MEHRNDWDPRADAVQIDQISAYDELRQRCPVAHSDFLGWSLLNHHDAMTALLDHEVYSSQVSRHVAVPNGMDPPEHTAYRAIIDRCFTAQFVDDFAPALRRLAEDLALRRRMGEAGRARALDLYAEDKVVARTLDLLGL